MTIDVFETSNDHDSGDCRIDCEHPDHAFDGDIDLGWFLLQLSCGRSPQLEEIAEHQEPVEL